MTESWANIQRNTIHNTKTIDTFERDRVTFRQLVTSKFGGQEITIINVLDTLRIFKMW